MYDRLIRESMARQGLAGVAPANQVEAWMRLECGTLDGLPRERFDREVREAVACCRADPDASARLAASYVL